MAALKKAVPALSDAQVLPFALHAACNYRRMQGCLTVSSLTTSLRAQLERMQLIPTRSFDPNIIQVSPLHGLVQLSPLLACSV